MLFHDVKETVFFDTRTISTTLIAKTTNHSIDTILDEVHFEENIWTKEVKNCLFRRNFFLNLSTRYGYIYDTRYDLLVAPDIILSDNGNQFTSIEFAKLYFEFDIIHTLLSPCMR